MRFGDREVDIGAQRVQRNPAFHGPIRAGDLGTTQPAGDDHFDAQGPCLQSPLHSQAQGAPVCHAAFQLLGHVPANQIRVQLRLPDFLDIEAGAFPGKPFQVAAQFVDTLAAAADDDPGPCGVDSDDKILRAALDLDARDGAAVAVPGGDGASDRLVLQRQRAVVARFGREPVRLPVLHSAETEPYRVGFLAQDPLPVAPAPPTGRLQVLRVLPSSALPRLPTQ